jgi:hypothetical protein
MKKMIPGCINFPPMQHKDTYATWFVIATNEQNHTQLVMSTDSDGSLAVYWVNHLIQEGETIVG